MFNISFTLYPFGGSYTILMTTFLFNRAIYAIVIRNAMPAGLQWIATADIKEM